MESRICDYDDESVTLRVIDQECKLCGTISNRVRFALEAVVSTNAPFVGITTVCTSLCCGTRRFTSVPPETVAGFLNHLENCNNHPRPSDAP